MHALLAYIGALSFALEPAPVTGSQSVEGLFEP
jgi:hypothetical protein